MTVTHKVTKRVPARSVEESIQAATAGVRLAGGTVTVTEANEAAARRVLNDTSTAEEELAALRRELLG